jgi:nitronate monooxygenase
MAVRTALTTKLGLSHPIVQAPMAGGGDTPALVAAVCEAGALGSIGAAYLTPQQVVESARAVRERTRRPFGINLFAPTARPEVPADMRAAVERVAPYFAELGLPPPAAPAAPAETFGDLLAAALDSGAAVFSFTLGVPPAAAIDAIKARDMLLAATATTVEEAIALERAGVDVIVAQGAEAGGHRGSFATDFDSSMIGTVALVPQIVDAVRAPVVASGGIMDGRGIAAALALGAAGALRAREHETRITRAFSGRPARGIANRFMTEAENAPAGAILPFPLQNALTRPLRMAAAKAGRAEFLSLWAGQGVRMARRETAAGLVARLVAETDEVLGRLAALGR